MEFSLEKEVDVGRKTSKRHLNLSDKLTPNINTQKL